MRSAFSTMLADLLEKSGLSQEEFATRVGVSQSVISRAIAGTDIPRVSRGPAWAIALELGEAEARDFIEALELANAPPGVQRLVRRLRIRIKQLERGR